MQIEGTKLVFIMFFSVLDFFKFASQLPQITQILALTFNIFWKPPPPSPRNSPTNFLFFFSLANLHWLFNKPCSFRFKSMLKS